MIVRNLLSFIKFNTTFIFLLNHYTWHYNSQCRVSYH